MASSFDPQLRELLSATHHNPETIVLNTRFARWERHLEVATMIERANHLRGYLSVNCFPDAQLKDVYEYKLGQDAKILEEARRHVSEHARPITGKILYLTHPLYASLHHWQGLNQSRRDGANDYVQKLWAIMKERPAELSIVLAEILQDYAAVTSLLLEQGLVDDVVFTRYNQGFPLQKKGLARFKGKTIIMAGGYNHRCLNHSLAAMIDASRSSKDIFVARDLVIDPALPNFISPQAVSFGLFGYVKSSRVKPLQEILDEL